MSSTDTYESLLQFLYRTPIGLVQTSPDGDIEMINPMASRLLMPLSRDGSLDNLFTVLEDVAPQLRTLVAGADCEALRIALEPVAGPIAIPQVLSIGVLEIDDRRLMVVVHDVSLEVHREQQGRAHGLRVATHTDRLTQLPNRAAVLEHLQMQVSAEPHVGTGPIPAVLFVNCDRFHHINDMLGPAVGDELLVALAQRLRSLDGVQLAARVGGDEFVVVLVPQRGPEDVRAIARTLLELSATPYAIASRQLLSGVSIGVVMGADATGDPDVVLRNASIAMVEAKRAGGARYVVFEPTMHERAARRGGIEAELRVAIAEAQLFVVYQPVVALQGQAEPGGCAGVEALVRWRHPTRGIVPPLEFIGVAEECGLISALGGFVLTTACHQFVRWQRELGRRAPAMLAVNVSRAQLCVPEYVDEVREILRASGMTPARLQLEVTESLAAQDAAVQMRLQELKALGLTLALDDFGTGYSSLSSLHLLPVDTVKIDRSFVSLADSSQHHRVLIDATVRVAKSLGMGTVAEGIETTAQSDTVRALGCDKGQGYLFSKPLAADELGRWLGSWLPTIDAAHRIAEDEPHVRESTSTRCGAPTSSIT